MGWNGKPVSQPPAGGYHTRHRPGYNCQKKQSVMRIVNAPSNRMNALYHGFYNKGTVASSVPVPSTVGHRNICYNPQNVKHLQQNQYDSMQYCEDMFSAHSQDLCGPFHQTQSDSQSPSQQNTYLYFSMNQQQQADYFTDGTHRYTGTSVDENSHFRQFVNIPPPFLNPQVQYDQFHHYSSVPLLAPHTQENENVMYSDGHDFSPSHFNDEDKTLTNLFSPRLNQLDYGAPDLNSVVVNHSQVPNYLKGHHMDSQGIHKAQRINMKYIDSEILKESISYVKSVYPNLGKQLYCVPSLDRSRHPDKASQLLVMRMESEKRVLGSFEQYFSSKQLPAVMLCHYPIKGFLFYRDDELLADKIKFSRCPVAKPSRSGVITLILLSNLFPVTVVTVHIVNGNSDFAYLQRAIKKAVNHSKQCVTSVRHWLSMMGVSVNTKEIIAFPNLKKTTMQRVLANNRSYSQMSFLLMENMSAPFEEESVWSSLILRLNFTEWIESHLMHAGNGLTFQELQIVVGTMCCPQLSRFESCFIDEMDDDCKMTETDNVSSKSKSEPEARDLSQLKLTIDNETKGLDEFMEDYISFYYPKLDSETYRVPPVHFNIQTKEKLSHDIFFPSSEEIHCQSGIQTTSNGDSDGRPPHSFMPPPKSYKYSLPSKRDLNKPCSDDKNVEELQTQTPSTDSTARLNIAIAMEDVHVLVKNMKKDIRADEGESSVIDAFELLGKKHGPMFIICSYQYNNYLNKLKINMFAKEETARPARAIGQKFRAQHDCLIFHKNYGAIIVSIKATGDNFEEWGASEEERIDITINTIKKALIQLDKEEAMVQYVTKDLCGSIHCHKLIALPNMFRADVSKALINAPDLLKVYISFKLFHVVENWMFHIYI